MINEEEFFDAVEAALDRQDKIEEQVILVYEVLGRTVSLSYIMAPFRIHIL